MSRLMNTERPAVKRGLVSEVKPLPSPPPSPSPSLSPSPRALAPGTARSWHPDETRLLLVDAGTSEVELHRVKDLPALVGERDLLVLNDAATLPASLHGLTAAGQSVEARLCGLPAEGASAPWKAVLFGAGDWRTPTEHRPPPPLVNVGERLRFGAREAELPLSAIVVDVDHESPRLIELVFELTGARFWEALYRAGRPVQYAHVPAPLPLWDVQTAFGTRPWAAEAPSASFPLSFDLLGRLRQRGLRWTTITHAAGLSSTGDARLDARLPLAERFEVGAQAVTAIEETRARGGQVVAIGTTVMRALESAAVTVHRAGELRAASGMTTLRLGPGSPRRVTDALLTGLHEEGSSHVALLATLAPPALWRRAQVIASSEALHGHELGDVALVRAAQPVTTR